MSETIQIIPIAGVPLVERGADVAGLLITALQNQKQTPRAGDILAVCSKVIAKAQGRVVPLADVNPGPLALSFARDADDPGADARIVQVVLNQARRIVKMDRGVLIVETHDGFVCANAGVDQSNVDGGDSVTLLPVDADAAARQLRQAFARQFGHDLAVVITDSFGRPWRQGQVDVAVGVAGFDPLDDNRGQHDLLGHELQATCHAVGDALAAAAGLCFGKASGVPACLIRGCHVGPNTDAGAARLVRPCDQDLFR